jgi:hypothetical protein
MTNQAHNQNRIDCRRHGSSSSNSLDLPGDSLPLVNSSLRSSLSRQFAIECCRSRWNDGQWQSMMMMTHMRLLLPLPLIFCCSPKNKLFITAIRAQLINPPRLNSVTTH